MESDRINNAIVTVTINNKSSIFDALSDLAKIFNNKWLPTMCNNVAREMRAFKHLISAAIFNGLLTQESLLELLACTTSFQDDEIDISMDSDDSTINDQIDIDEVNLNLNLIYFNRC